MKKQYFKSLPKRQQLKRAAYESHFKLINSRFEEIQESYSREKAVRFFDLIRSMKKIKEMKKADKQPIFRFFLEREIKSLQSVKNGWTTDFKIMKALKCKCKDIKVDWKELWERLVKECPETSFNSNSIQQLIKSLKIYYDENNAVEVWKYFQTNYPSFGHNFMSLFTRINSFTRDDIFDDYISILRKECELDRIQRSEFIVIFLGVAKCRKQISLSKEMYTFINDIMLELVMTCNERNNQKSKIQTNFNMNAATILEHILGKANSGSINLLNTIFSFLKKFVKPLENSTKAVSFMYNLLKGLFLRIQKEKEARERLQKLNKKLNENEKEKEKNEEEEEDEDEDEEEGKEEEENELILDDNLDEGFLINEDEQNEIKPDNDEERRQKLLKVLVNELTQPIIDCLQGHISQIFEQIYYVNSKKAIPHLLRYIYRIFPSLAIKSIDVIDKAASIPNINEQGLVKNMIVGVQHMFMEENYQEGVKNLMRVMEKAYNCRRIIDVWAIYEAINSKIPLLDQKDLELIPEADKTYFEETFQMNHDRFYEEYSEFMLEAFKRLLREGEHIDKNEEKKFTTTMAQIHCSSYPCMKKRLLNEVMEVVTDKPNGLALFYFIFSELPKKEADILTTQFKSLNMENKNTEDIRLNMLGILAKSMSLQQMKPYIREMASKGHFRLLHDYSLYKIIEDIQWKPWPTTLKYFKQNPKVTIVFDIPCEDVKKNLKQLESYRDELLEQVVQQAKNIKIEESQSLTDRIIDSYIHSEKIKTYEERRKIYEALTLAALINQLMEKKILTVRNNKLETVESEVSIYGFLKGKEPYSKTLKFLLQSQEILSDPKIIQSISNILGNEYFMYEDIQKNQQKKAIKEKKKNKNHEAPGYANRIHYGNEYISTSRVLLSAINHRESDLDLKVEKTQAEDLFVLLMINSNESIRDILNLFAEKGNQSLLKDELMNLVRRRVENRFLIKKISDVLDYIGKHHEKFAGFCREEIIEIVDYHSALVQSNESKIREFGIKSFKKIIKILTNQPIDDALISDMDRYLKIEKMQMIWIIYVIIVINHPDQQADLQKFQQRLLRFIKQIEPLLLHQSRSVRRTSLYVTSSLVRKLKKIHSKYETVEIQEKYEKKTLNEFLESGFLRPMHYKKDLKNRKVHFLHPYESFKSKKQFILPEDIFSFLIDDPEKGLKFMKNFHSDMAATTEMLISSFQNSMLTVDLFSVATKALENVFFTTKTKEMAVSKSQSLIGGRFFKYLCNQDFKKGLKFFKSVKEFILESLNNLESLDNQTVVLVYSYTLMNAYESNYTEKNAQVQEFLLKIFQEIINKSSGAIFRKFEAVFFLKCRNRGAVEFIVDLCQKMVQEKRKVSRAGKILTTIYDRSYRKRQEILKILLKNRLELEKNYVTQSISSLSSYPYQNAWLKEEIETTGIIDLQSHIDKGELFIFDQDYVVLENSSLHKEILGELTKMIDSEEIQTQKTGFSILVSVIRCFKGSVYEKNSDLACEFLKLGFKIVNTKNELQLDYEGFYKSLREFFGSRKLTEAVFEKYLLTVFEFIDPKKKRSVQILTEILTYPCNYLTISSSLLVHLTKKILQLEENNVSYKQCLTILSTLYSFKCESLQKVKEMESDKQKRMLLLQAYCLANYNTLDHETVKEVLANSNRERKNIWAREMMLLRGQKEYFEKEQIYQLWRTIKSFSNPYHYHA